MRCPSSRQCRIFPIATSLAALIFPLMNLMREILNRNLLAAGLIALVLAQSLRASEPTAFELIKEGNRHVGETAKDKVVQIRSEKSIAGVTPNIWWIVY